MAKKVKITMLDDTADGFTISQNVGIGAGAGKGDVMLIQAMTNFIAVGHNDLGMVGLKARNELPDVTGMLDSTTIFAIMSYQFRWMRLLWSTASGIVFTIDFRSTSLQNPTQQGRRSR